MAVHEHALDPVTIHDVGDDGYCDYCRPYAVPDQMEKALELLQALYLTATHHSGVKKNLKRAIISVQNAIGCRES